jgi:hypothetical protein
MSFFDDFLGDDTQPAAQPTAAQPRKRKASALAPNVPIDDRRVRFNSTVQVQDIPARVSKPTASSSKRARKATGVSKRPKDVLVEDAAEGIDALRPTQEPAMAIFDTNKSASVLRPAANGHHRHDDDNDDDDNDDDRERGQENGGEGENEDALALGPTHMTTDAYPMTSRFLVERVMKSGDLDDQEGDEAARDVQMALRRGQQRRMGVSAAAFTNYMTRIVQAERALGGNVTQLAATPYTTNTTAFSQCYISAAIERSPDAAAAEQLPSDEMRAKSEGVWRAYIEKYMRTARPNEYPCARHERCFGMRLFDDNGEQLPPTVWRAFWFPSEEQEVEAHPEKFRSEADYRCCIGCKIDDANKVRNNVKARNNRVDPTVLSADFHVFVDVHGEFPSEATVGRCDNGYVGLVNNVPRSSVVGWSAKPDGQRAGCYLYRWSIPQFPIDKSYYDRDIAAAGTGGPQGF